MKKDFGKEMKVWALAALTLFSGATFTSCNDEIDAENRFTFKGELISTYLENNPETFSNFCVVLDKAKIGKKASGSVLKTLSTYGSYTCFAPTNKAIDDYLLNEYNTYIESVEANKLDPSVQIYRTGITSPYLEELSDSMATEIAKNHIIEMGYMTTDINEGAFPKVTMNRRITTVEWITDENGRVFPLLNNNSRIIDQDLEMENGYVQVVDAVLNPSSSNIHELLGQHLSFSLFYTALKATGLDKLLDTYEIDPDYDGTLYGPQFSNKAGNPRYPEEHKQRYSLLVESNDLLADPSKNHMGISITTIDDLEKLASAWYGTEALGDHSNPKNPLHKYIQYHIIDRQLLYSSSTGPGGFLMESYEHKGFNSEINMPTSYDRCDYFETELPYTMIKVTKPFTNDTPYEPYGNNEEPSTLSKQIILNYAQDGGTRCNNQDMKYYLNVVVEPARITKARPGLEDFDQSAINGIIHTIDRILIYNEEEMAGNVLNERMRWDASSLFPELTNNGVRWMPQEEVTAGDKVYIPEDFCTRLRHRNNQTNIYYLRPHQTGLEGYSTFMGDEIMVSGKYDFEYRLPYVPSGNYEVRFGFNQSDARGIAQFYMDGKICGIPVDMREGPETEPIIGWFDESNMSEEEINENDKSMRNRGWMKGPASVHLTNNKESMRVTKKAVRRIVGTFRLDTGTEHWIRFKDVRESGLYNELSQDYLEIVPTSVLSNPTKPEDRN